MYLLDTDEQLVQRLESIMSQLNIHFLLIIVGLGV